ncbi:ATP-binding protein [Thermococcus thioreducens]|uniref:AAA+-type ATPase, SpoVK/Ycf46/Vps4 family n=1 Tax=Thermococcus thioreducens TaxID=277988 RepID=A0A1I0MHJ2_9EURY|nr:ATP-binding protein [Thermococcus thioreducens]ASJ12651.1 cell division protein [Thermococcus thioreducens]SEV87230.1 AAA+-type ATPase, SpoVK/Ycf46/Vps4 family [Thermococcus thioreducens]
MPVDLSGPLLSEFERAKKEFERAVAAGDMETARRSALRCASILRQLARHVPYNGELYLKKAKKWEDVAGQIESGEYGRKAVVGAEGKSTTQEKDEEDQFREYVLGLISKSQTTWDDIGGLEGVKLLMMETVVIAALKKPAAVQPWRGILLFGPPGTGKTLLASAAAGSLNATFFNVKASSVLSKYFGESSKIISALYEVAREKAPSIVFLDEIDALTTRRSNDTSEATRRMLSTLLTELEGFHGEGNEKLVLTLAATNTPWDLDEAVLSRFPKRIYVPLPDKEATKVIVRIHTEGLDISRLDLDAIAEESVRRLYSGRDIRNLCQEAIWNMIREENKDLHRLAGLPFEELRKRSLRTRPLEMRDFEEAFRKIKSPLTKRDIERYEKWAEEFGG